MCIYMWVCVCVYQAPATIRRCMNYASHMAMGSAHICPQAATCKSWQHHKIFPSDPHPSTNRALYRLTSPRRLREDCPEKPRRLSEDRPETPRRRSEDYPRKQGWPGEDTPPHPPHPLPSPHPSDTPRRLSDEPRRRLHEDPRGCRMHAACMPHPCRTHSAYKPHACMLGQISATGN